MSRSLWVSLTCRMKVDYIRVYRKSVRLASGSVLTHAEDPNKRNIGCDPDTMPTAKYISL